MARWWRRGHMPAHGSTRCEEGRGLDEEGVLEEDERRSLAPAEDPAHGLPGGGRDEVWNRAGLRCRGLGCHGPFAPGARGVGGGEADPDRVAIAAAPLVDRR